MRGSRDGTGSSTRSWPLALPELRSASSLLAVDDSPKEACGVFGLYAPGQPVSHMTYLGLFALQHRGQEAAGIAVSDGHKMWVDKDTGLVSTVFDDRRLQTLQGDLAIGHTRYSTTGSGDWNNCQPVYRDVRRHQFALAHNGNLVNTAELSERLEMPYDGLGSDSALVAELVARELSGREPRGDSEEVIEAFIATLPQLRGAFSLVLLGSDFLIGARDPQGFRPLFLGRLDDGWVLASETPALDVVGAEVVREIAPGEVVVIDGDGVHARTLRQPTAAPALCSFEFVYFARPDGNLLGQNVHRVRRRMGQALARQAPVSADAVVPIPESSVPGAQGYAEASGIPFVDGFVKNRYIGRTFIAPNQELRANAVRIKLNPIRENIDGQRLVVVEDSIIRATTLRETMRMMRAAGAAEIHLRVLSPPYKWPCWFGMDTTDRSKLVASHMSVEEICDYLGADSLVYLDIDAMVEAITPGSRGGLCTACLTGDYPIPVPDSAIVVAK
ncbi:amidophosphoribosyltransferase [Nocardia farcinica]|uniref:amidophosphoribosyltransferase n=1 Tax=Nocardia farcinica TaxID=37329 RepID=UPI0018949523|nr:amidophosphoribosyltransferase [Nocardia farcinica]MBF6294551.1 amidophosphoribosyltransferase [Nocardia farcinica]MBF6382112.1 amidophosphoribosyltransferase [Nocardia farcinica]MBF6388007.1 amidophosphoribosyltransferase [Nocardia farcinica]